jgi:hypothetical protein
MSYVQCVICKKSVKLEDCKCNEFGQPVHEDCYASNTVFYPASMSSTPSFSITTGGEQKA